MGEMKEWFHAHSIKAAYIRSMLTCIFGALLAALALSFCCQSGQDRLLSKYRQGEEDVVDGTMIGFKQLEEEHGIQLFYQVPSYSPLELLTPSEELAYNIMGIFSVAVYPLCFIVGIIGSSLLFYRRQLQEPFAILNHATEQIAANNLDFQVVYEKKDELGRLCASFEKMRLALRENNEEMWRQMEERRRLNAAFSHDLRTPLTVLRGQSELLMRYAPKMTPEKMAETAGMMRRHIARLESYVKTMGDLQRLEDIEIRRQSVPLGELLQQLTATGETVCRKKEFQCQMLNEAEVRVYVDRAIVLQVYENLLSNALRFSRKRIAAMVQSEDGYLYLTVSDDGDGFAEEDLEQATKPFYKTVQETGKEHFGIGLNICKILCEKHGGYIRLENRGGALVTAAFGQGKGIVPK